LHAKADGTLTVPAVVRTGVPYYLAVYEQVDGTFLVMLTPEGSPNSGQIRFG